MKRFLQIYHDGRPSRVPLTQPLAEGEQGNIQTLTAMKALVLEQRSEPDLRRWVDRVIIRRAGVAGHDTAGELEAIFEYCRDKITYRQDPFGVERVADMWSTISILDLEGDCGIKSTFFATCCALLGYKPFFAVIRQRPDQKTFNHVYNAVALNGRIHYFDATPEESVPGFEAPSVDKRIVPIFD